MKNQEEGSNFSAIVFLIIAVLAIWTFIKKYQAETTIETLVCKVEKLEEQNKVSGSGSSIKTEIRYLVITDKETFVVKDSFWNAKYNNSDLFLRLKEGKTYQFKVCGMKKSAMYDYRNILEYYERKN